MLQKNKRIGVNLYCVFWLKTWNTADHLRSPQSKRDFYEFNNIPSMTKKSTKYLWTPLHFQAFLQLGLSHVTGFCQQAVKKCETCHVHWEAETANIWLLYFIFSLCHKIVQIEALYSSRDRS